MGYHVQLAVTVLLLGITGVSAETMETWKLVAIIVPSVVGGLTLLTCLFYCCCYSTRGSGGHGMGCGGCENECKGGCCNAGCDAGCNGGCCNGCDDCCGCCVAHPPQRVTQQVYSSSQGPIQVQPVQKYRSAPLPAIGYGNEPTYVRSVPGAGFNDGVYGVSRQTAPVYGSAPPQQIYGGGQGVGYGGGPGGVYGGGRPGW